MKNQGERIDNISLIENNLLHLNFELERDDTSYFRVAREAHQVFYRSMAEALRGADNRVITGRPKGKERSAKYQLGDAPFMEIHRVGIEGCKKAWRYSPPTPCEAPREIDGRSQRPPFNYYLKSFYDLLAMIQTECFMKRYVMSKPVNVSGDEMKSLESLHEEIRNKYEHFVPMLYLATIRELVEASLICIDKTEKLILESGNLFPSEIPETLKTLIGKIKSKLHEILHGLDKDR